MAVTISVGRGRNSRPVTLHHVTKSMMAVMTEKTQIDFFGEVVAKRYDRSIHNRAVS